MKKIIFLLSSVCLLLLHSCKKGKDSSNSTASDFVDGEFNGRYTINTNLCVVGNEYIIDLPGTASEVPNYSEYKKVLLSTVPNPELPWHFQKLKNGKYIVYSKRNDSSYLLWTFYEHPLTVTNSGNIPKPSHKLIMKRMNGGLPQKPNDEFQFEFIKTLNPDEISIRGGGMYITCYYAYIKKPNVGGPCPPNLAGISLGGPVFHNLDYGEVKDGNGNNWAYYFSQPFRIKKVP
jgi:hypothetical protein